MEIVTGHRGTPHVTPYKVRDFNIGIVGAEDYVMNGGSELEAQLVSNNRIDIKDGSICMQGTHAVIPKNINDELTIENGMQGEKRIDLIVARYEKVSDSGVESVNTVVLQGTPSKESPIVPGHVVGDIRNGDLKHEMPLYEVELDGINVVEVRPVFKKIVSAAEQQKMIELLNGKLKNAMDGGVVSTRVGNQSTVVVEIPFNKKFTSPPAISCSIETPQIYADKIAVKSVSTTMAEVYVNTSTTEHSAKVHWTAVSVD